MFDQSFGFIYKTECGFSLNVMHMMLLINGTLRLRNTEIKLIMGELDVRKHTLFGGHSTNKQKVQPVAASAAECSERGRQDSTRIFFKK